MSAVGEEAQASTSALSTVIGEGEEPNALPAASASAAAQSFLHHHANQIIRPVYTADSGAFEAMNQGIRNYRSGSDIADSVEDPARERRRIITSSPESPITTPATTTQAATAPAATLTVSTPSQADSTVATSLATTTTAASRPAASASVVTTIVAPTAATGSRPAASASVVTTIVAPTAATASRPAASAPVVTTTVAPTAATGSSSSRTASTGEPTVAPRPTVSASVTTTTVAPTAATGSSSSRTASIGTTTAASRPTVLLPTAPVTTTTVSSAGATPAFLAVAVPTDSSYVPNQLDERMRNYSIGSGIPVPVEDAARAARMMVTNSVLPTPLAPVLAPIVPVIGAPAVTTAATPLVRQDQIRELMAIAMQGMDARPDNLNDVVNETYRLMPALERNGDNEGRIMAAYYEIINGDNIGGAEDEEDNPRVVRPDNLDEQDVEDEEPDQTAQRNRIRRAAANQPAAAQPLAAGAGGGSGNGGAPDPDADAQAAADAAAQAQADAAAQAKLEAEAKELMHAQGVTKMQVSVGADANKTAQAPISNRFGEIMTKALVAAGDEPDSLPKGVWISGVYGKSKQGTTPNNAKYNAAFYGPTIGADININDNNIVGIAYSYILSNYKFKDNLNRKLNTKSNVISLYSHSQLNEDIIWDNILSISFSKVRVKDLGLNPGTSQLVTGKYKNTAYSLDAKLGYRIPTEDKSVSIVPYIGLWVGHSKDSRYTLGKVEVDSKSESPVAAVTGVQIAKKYRVAENTTITPSLDLGLEKSFNKKSSTVKAKFAGTNEYFPTQVHKKSKGLEYNIGASVLVNHDNIDIGVGYSCNLQKKYQAHQGYLKLKVAL
ncbi:unnamed protein product [Rotaria sp. Silwood2]|nr:unnamed protein product [Rotaria sp. Silwood2]